MQEKNQEMKLEIQLDEETAQGIYANLAVVNHTDAEFSLDFIYVQPQTPRGKVRARIILSPKHFKRLLGAMEENLRRHEKHFGTIDTGPQTLPEIGDYGQPN